MLERAAEKSVSEKSAEVVVARDTREGLNQRKEMESS
jgi:hypothetical protein